MRGSSGIWELFVPGVGPGTLYKYEIRTRAGTTLLKADPYGFAMQLRPGNASIVVSLDGHDGTTTPGIEARRHADHTRRPINVYEAAPRELAARLGAIRRS
jgi:1,4-alpha-glucan branching enzyme